MDTKDVCEQLINRPVHRTDEMSGKSAAHESPVLITLRGTRNGHPDPRLEEWSAPPGWKRDMWTKESTLFPAVRPGLVLSGLEDHLVIEDPLSRDKHVLNSIATSLFLMCNGRRSASDIVEFWGLTLGEKSAGVGHKVRQVLHDLVQKKVLILRPAQRFP